MGVEVLMVGALGWPTPTEDMGFWRPALGEPSLAERRERERERQRTKCKYLKRVLWQDALT